jgi:hypothetical protein
MMGHIAGKRYSGSGGRGSPGTIDVSCRNYQIEKGYSANGTHGTVF